MYSSFSSFKDFCKITEENNDSEQNDLCVFFKKNGSVYGATEEGRITYARMKNPESKEDISWKKDAVLILYDLEKESEDKRIMIKSSEISKFDLISQDKAEKILKKKGKKIPVIKDEDDDSYYGEE